MKLTTTLKAALALAFAVGSTQSDAQIYSYGTDSAGMYASVATHATGSNMGRINGAGIPAPACHDGFSSRTYPSTTTFATTLPADTMSVAAASGYKLSVTSFSVDIRRSPTGPQKVRYAYKLDTATTWTDQGIDQSPNNAGCDSTITVVWTTSLTVVYPRKLEFAIFGF